MKKIYLFLTAFVFMSVSALAQSNGGAIKVTLNDKKTKEGIPFANVVVLLDNIQVAVGTTDMDGNVMIKPLVAGKYTVKAVYVGYQKQEIKGVEVLDNKTVYLPISLSNEEGVNLDQVVVTEYAVDLIDKDTKSGGTVDRESFQHQSDKTLNSIISTQAGVTLMDNGSGTSIRVRGARANNTAVFVDGERSIGTNNLPQSAVEQMSVILGGLPAQYGDATGGVVSITTRGVQPKWFGGVEGITSGNGANGNNKYVGTDPYGYNFGGFSIGGPIWSKKDSSGTKKPIIGFFMGGEIIYQKDPRPWATGVEQINPTTMAQIQQNPLLWNSANSAYYTAGSFVTPNNLVNNKVRPNVGITQIRLSPKITFAITPKTTITVGGSWDYSKYHQFSIYNVMFNSASNPQVIENTKRAYVRFQQQFGSENASEQEKSQSVIKRASFNFQASYNAYKFVMQDEHFKDNYFNYGYVGKFDEKRVPIYQLDTGVWVKQPNGHYSKVNAYDLKGYTDSIVNFTPGTLNPLAANYTSEVYNQFNGQISNMYMLQNYQGLRNGDSPNNVQGLYSSSGNTTNNYSLRNNTMFRITSNFQADIKNHNLMIGIEYDQRVERGFDVSTKYLWAIARQLANMHNQNLYTAATDTSASNAANLANQQYYTYSQYTQSAPNVLNPALTGNNGISTTQTLGAPVTSTYGVLVHNTQDNTASQSVFSKNFYDQIGVNGDHNPNSTQYINVDAVNPSQLNLGMFAPDELLNSGQQVVSSWGYDFTGKPLSGKTNFDDFLTKFHYDKFGDKVYDRNSGAFTPVYMAGYIQDKFDFKDIKFNVGLRVDRYDANQQVLKDPFLLKDAYTIADLSSLKGQYEGTIPSSLPQNAVVYVAQNAAAQSAGGAMQIVGYRSGMVWYDANGAAISDPTIIAHASGGAVQPWLKSPNDQNPYSNTAFQAYKPQINVMPRVAFSFPISDVANFFAHYDILVQRPPASFSDGANGAPYTSYNRTNPQDYYFIASNQGAVVGNGNLKPEKTIDYELGFSQILNESKSAALKISAFYREMRNQVQITRVNQAYPVSYMTYGNMDFGTVQGLSLEYQMRRTGGFSLNANYTLQFAEGSGSNANGGYNLANSSQPNMRVITPLDYDQRHNFVLTLDYRFGQGKDYRGPQSDFKKGDKSQTVQWLKNFGINLVGRLGSGLPYSQRYPAIADVEVGNNNNQYLSGSLNGSRLPWQFRVDMRIDRNFSVRLSSKEKGDDKARFGNLNFYLQVMNLFNTMNIVQVHSYTGSPKDDGYLSSQYGMQELNGKYAQSYGYGYGFQTLYNAKLMDGRYYSAPRMIRIGVQFDF
ncbi:MAG: TonB-dependent receptor [Bacteroidetes bacterium]|nr:TonB-dependent receptor [Bacteroidota bacterium]